MQIDFLSPEVNLAKGSYRIWVRDLAARLKALGADVAVLHSPEHSRPGSVVILSKDCFHWRASLQSNAVVGAINPTKEQASQVDFVIAGSLEEKLSLVSSCRHVVIINLIEQMFEAAPTKEHRSTLAPVIVGFHGSSSHLPKLTQGFSVGFQTLLREGYDLAFHCVTETQMDSNTVANITSLPASYITCKLYTPSTIHSDLLLFDIGIVPTLTDLRSTHSYLLKDTSNDRGLYTSDYVFRFKNKTNPGRAFVLFQLGIPVIADLAPSLMPMLHDETCGYVSCCPDSWAFALRHLMTSKQRNKVAVRAQARFRSLYSADNDARSLLATMRTICTRHHALPHNE